jgi:hypothetical protein
MKWIWRISAALVVAAWLTALPEPVSAQSSSDATKSKDELKGEKGQIKWTYVEVPKPDYTSLELMHRLKVLETLSKFLSFYRLPQNLSLQVVPSELFPPDDKECAAYIPDLRTIRICTGFVEFIEKLAPAPGEKSNEGFTRDEVIQGALWGVVLHETGHALFDMLEIPVFGREEDAADQMAIFLTLETVPSKAVEQRVIGGFAQTWRAMSKDLGRKARYSHWTGFTDEHGSDEQRYRNTVCLAYGGDQETFRRFVTLDVHLSEQDLKNCTKEYAQIKRAFYTTVVPFIDQDKLKAAQAGDAAGPGGR